MSLHLIQLEVLRCPSSSSNLEKHVRIQDFYYRGHLLIKYHRQDLLLSGNQLILSSKHSPIFLHYMSNSQFLSYLQTINIQCFPRRQSKFVLLYVKGLIRSPNIIRSLRTSEPCYQELYLKKRTIPPTKQQKDSSSDFKSIMQQVSFDQTKKGDLLYSEKSISSQRTFEGARKHTICYLISNEVTFQPPTKFSLRVAQTHTKLMKSQDKNLKENISLIFYCESSEGPPASRQQTDMHNS